MEAEHDQSCAQRSSELGLADHAVDVNQVGTPFAPRRARNPVEAVGVRQQGHGHALDVDDGRLLGLPLRARGAGMRQALGVEAVQQSRQPIETLVKHVVGCRAARIEAHARDCLGELRRRIGNSRPRRPRSFGRTHGVFHVAHGKVGGRDEGIDPLKLRREVRGTRASGIVDCLSEDLFMGEDVAHAKDRHGASWPHVTARLCVPDPRFCLNHLQPRGVRRLHRGVRSFGRLRRGRRLGRRRLCRCRGCGRHDGRNRHVAREDGQAEAGGEPSGEAGARDRSTRGSGQPQTMVTSPDGRRGSGMPSPHALYGPGAPGPSRAFAAPGVSRG